MRKGIVISIAAALCVALVPGIALAGKVKSKVDISNPTFGLYGGTVTAEKQKCVAGRTVEVWHDTNGNGKIDPDVDFQIGTGKTDQNGDYEIAGNQAPVGDRVIAKVRKRKKGRTRCLEATGSVIVDG
jgi:hypothetical protein